jgi:hypothetical protein
LNLSFFWLDEGIYCGYAAWRVMKARLRQRGLPLQGVLTSTPRGQDRFYQDFEANPLPGHRLIRAATRENTFLPEGYADSLGYTGTFALQELEGHFVAREGLVYHLAPENVAPAPATDELTEVFGGIDWGYRNPFHASVFGMRAGVAHLIAEARTREGGLERAIIPTILALTRQWGITAWYAGPDRPENIAAVGEQLRAAGVRCTVQAAENSVLDGIETVRSLLECDPVRLIIAPGCVHTLRELAEYHYPDGIATGSPARDENPLKAEDHALDAMRYALHSRLGAARQRRQGMRFLAQLQHRLEHLPPTETTT